MAKRPDLSLANLKYERLTLDIKREIEFLQKKLKNHQNKQKLEQANYGFAGDAEYVLQGLQVINEFLT